MKIKSIYNIIAVLFLASVFSVACTKKNSEVRLAPTLSTSQVLDVKSDSATVVGFVVAQGSGFDSKGVCYGTAANPTVDNNKVAYQGESSTATFKVVLSGLDYATKYYARAYAVGSNGPIYGEQMTFTTLPVIPTVVTDSAYATSGTSAKGGGNVTNDGGAAVTARGVCYSTNSNPTTADNITSDGNGTGSFTSTLTGLSGTTTYYIRAYATNSAGTAYGQQDTITTPQALVTLFIAGDYQGWDPANATDSIMNDNSSAIVRGYAYISTTGGFKFTSEHSWNGTNYGAGANAGDLSTDANAGNLSVSPAGYYLFNVDLANMTYTALLTNWGVIGDATAGGWSSDQPMTYSPTLKRWFATIPMTVGTFKFRANSSWDAPNPNYGSNNGDDTLQAGGSNINVTAAGTYSVMMNLSAPLRYTYALTKWSIIGSSTPNGDWSTDVDLVPNTTNNTWTVTTYLLAGEFKFRANHDWGINLGGASGSLSWGGANIKIATAGTYTITLDLANGTYSVQ